MNNRLNVVRLCHLGKPFKIGDIAQLPDDGLRIGHDQMQALAIFGDIEHHGRGAQLAQLFNHPGANTTRGTGDEYGLTRKLCAVAHDDFFSSLSLKLTSRPIAALMRALSSAG